MKISRPLLAAAWCSVAKRTKRCELRLLRVENQATYRWYDPETASTQPIYRKLEVGPSWTATVEYKPEAQASERVTCMFTRLRFGLVFKLIHERCAEEVKHGLHDKKKSRKKSATKRTA